MSTTWLDGRISAHEWKKMHPAEHAREGDEVIREPEAD
jgi:hypothetical protein